MKKLILFLLLIPSLLFAQDWQEARMNLTVVGGVTPSGVTYGCPTCDTDLRCEDNAATTVVTNSGTGAAWVAGANTDTLTSTEKVEGSRSFLLQTDSTHYIKSSVNWTSEKFEITFYMKLVNATPGATQVYLLVSSSLGGTPAGSPYSSNEISLYKNSTADTQLRMRMRGAGGTGYEWNSTNGFTNDTAWHKYTITVDASTAPWTSVVVLQDTTTLTWDISTYPTAAATFNNPIWIGTSGTAESDAYFDVITVKDNT